MTKSPEDRSVRTHKGAAAIISALSIGLLAIWLVPGDPAKSQNRAAAEFPTLTASSLVHESTFRAIDAALRDRVGAQVPVVEAFGTASVDLLGASPNQQVILGPDRQPFYTEDFTRPCREDDTSLRALHDQLHSDAAAFENAGKDVLYIVAPDKSSVRSEIVDSISPDLLKCSTRVREAFEGWVADGDLPLVALWDDVAALDSEDEPAYIFGDTHWNWRGATAMTRAIVSAAVDAGDVPDSVLEDLSSPTIGEPERISPDLNVMMGIPDTELDFPASFERSGVVTSSETTYSDAGTPQLHFTSESTDAPLIPGKTLVLGDSFTMTQLLTQLPSFFEDVTIAEHHEYAQSAEFDRVIVERVQRYALTGDWPPLASTLK